MLHPGLYEQIINEGARDIGKETKGNIIVSLPFRRNRKVEVEIFAV